MPCKLRITMGIIEFEYEGDADFTHESIKDLFTHMEAITATAVPPTTIDSSSAPPVTMNEASNLTLDVSTVAARLGAKDGSDLALAAAAKIQLIDKKSKFSRTELHNEMTSATAFYKKSMTGNLTRTLNNLVKSGSFNGQGNDSYSLSAKKLSELETKIAE